jgi:RNA polymerase sigma factor (sigma-70 family)
MSQAMPETQDPLLDDRDLLNLIIHQDPHAFEQLYDRYAGMVYRLLLRIVGEPSVAAELLQETFWQGWQKVRTYQDGGPLAAPFFQIARARALDQLRQQTVQTDRPAEDAPRYHQNEITKILPAYVLGTLEPEEMLALDGYIQHNKTVLLHLRQLEERAAHSLFKGPEVELPQDVKRHLMMQIREMTRSEPAAAPEAETDRANGPPDPATDPSPANPAMRPVRTGWRQHKLLHGWADHRFLWTGLSAIALIILVTLVGIQIQNQRSLQATELATVQRDLAALRVENQQLQDANQHLQQRLSLRERQLTLFADATRVVTLEGTEEAPEANGSFHVGQLSSVLVLRKLPPLPEDQAYELWLIPEQGDPVSAGVVQVDETGMSSTLIPMAIQPRDFAAVGLSVEPASGSEQPTGPIVLLGTISY